MVRKILMILCIAFTSSLAGLCPNISTQQKAIKIHEAKKHLFYLTVFDKLFTPDLLKQAMFFEGVYAPEIVFTQAKLETGNFSSDLFVNGCNLFGMRYPAVRDTYATGVYKYHASYNTWVSSVKDIVLWQDWYIEKGFDLSNYLVFLQRVGYAKDKQYITKLKDMS